jgi:hypothetical protein
MSLEGLMTSQKVQLYYDYHIVKDITNGIHAEVKYNPNFDKSWKGVASRYTVGWFKNTLGHNHKTNRPARGDDVIVKIIKRADKNYSGKPDVLEQGDELVAEGDGSWLSYLKIDDVVIWRIEDPVPQWKPIGDLSSGDLLLESDTSKRQDVPFMRASNWEEAEVKKVELEELQRAD